MFTVICDKCDTKDIGLEISEDSIIYMDCHICSTKNDYEFSVVCNECDSFDVDVEVSEDNLLIATCNECPNSEEIF